MLREIGGLIDLFTDNITGCVPGPKNQIIRVQDALGKPWPKGPMNTAELAPQEVLAAAAAADAAATGAEATTATA